MKNKKLLAGFFIAWGFVGTGYAEGQFKVLEKIAIGGEGGWDYLSVNPEGRQLFVAHGVQVEVVDLDTNKIIGAVPDTPGVHGVAVASPFGLGFVSNGKSASVSIIDLKTLKKTGEVPAGLNPDCIIFDPAANRVFAFNGKSKDSTVIDAKSGKVVQTIPLSGKPEFAVSDGKGHVFVNIEDKNSLSRLNSKNLKVEKTWELSGCEEPSGLAMDQAHNRLFVGCANKTMTVVNAQNGKVIAHLPIGDHSDAIVFDPEEKLVFSSNGDGTLTVIREDTKNKFHVMENVITERGARTMALDPKTHRIYLATAQFGETPAPTAEHPHPRPAVVPGTFMLLVVGR